MLIRYRNLYWSAIETSAHKLLKSTLSRSMLNANTLHMIVRSMLVQYSRLGSGGVTERDGLDTEFPEQVCPPGLVTALLC